MSPHKNQNGFILFYALIIVGVLSLIGEAYFMSISTDLQNSARMTDSIRAFYVADAGLADIFMQLRAASAPGSTNTTGNKIYTVGTRSGIYNANWSSDGASWPTYTLISSGTYGASTKTLSLKVRASSFSKYGYLSNTENDPVWGANWFITGMITTGPAHTNGQFSIFGSPIFTGAVSQVAPTVNYWSGFPVDNPDFQEGLTTNAPAVVLPTASTSGFINGIKSAAQQPQGTYLEGNTAITFVNDGTMKVTNSQNHWNNHIMFLPENHAVFVKNGTVTVQGVLSGNVTVGTNQDIVIGGNILYKTDPQTHPESTDLLGLVAQNNVTVTDHGPNNITIDGYIVALTGQFSVQNFWSFLKGDMVQYGGLSTNLPGGLTGLFNPGTGEMVAGYNQLQYFDQRLKNEVPMYFPPATDASNRTIYTKVAFNDISGALLPQTYDAYSVTT